MRTKQPLFDARKGERGAALITSIMISMLLLTVAGTVILTSGMSATTAIDSTAELQAFYGAESGIEATLDVLRGNVAPGPGMPGNSKISYRNAVDVAISNKPSDSSTEAHLSGWLNYGGNGRVTPSGTNFSYSLVLFDPDDLTGATRNADANYQPNRLVVQSTGYGPRGSIKRIEAVVEKTQFDFNPNCTVCGRSADDGSPGTWGVGSSSAKFYTGHDNAGEEANLPTFGVSSANDLVALNAAITKPETVDPERTTQVAVSSMPSWLESADKAREFLTYMKTVAQTMDRYYSTYSGVAGSTSSPEFTFVDGNCTLDGGAGLLIVTGSLTMNGNDNFKGVILVLGEGSVTRDGSGNGDILGSIYIAKFARSWPSSENGQPHPFLATYFDTNGGGNGDMLYDSSWIQKAKDVLGTMVRDIREY
ncbi:MAG TPA: pilus assembly PilX N-terminal domain-containing protein [Pyrinomonadaceae bacterium]|nr:pilus assembly PilX N-terminal domain-containing protein [Pyrinomonadaceae bacterium]